jgi:hypothetical protein
MANTLAQPTPQPKLFLNIALHLLGWGILFFLPYLFMPADAPRTYNTYVNNGVPLLFAAILFYINYFYLIDRFLFKQKILIFLLLNVALFALCWWGIDELRDVLISYDRPPLREGMRELAREGREGMPYRGSRGGGGRARAQSFAMARNIFMLLLAGVASIAIKVTQRWQATEQEKQTLASENLKSELSHLHYQLQPHFFFNSLNNIYAMVDTAPEEAKEAIHGLAKLMRYMLYETKEESVPLAKEVDFLQRLIHLMEIRLPRHVMLSSSFPANTAGLHVAPLLFVPLVENAFKHGVSARQPSSIHISMHIEGGEVIFETENTNFPKEKEDRSGSGIGLENLQKRLALLYAGRYTFVHRVEADQFKARLTLNL